MTTARTMKSPGHRKRLLHGSALAAILAIAATAVAILMLCHTAIEQQEEQRREAVASQTQLIETIARLEYLDAENVLEMLPQVPARDTAGMGAPFVKAAILVLCAVVAMVAVGAFLLITQRKEAEKALLLTQFSLDHAADAALWITSDAHIFYANEAACHALEYSREELTRLTVHDVDPLFPREVWADHWDELRQRRTFTFESAHRKKSGEVFPVEVTASFVQFDGMEYNCVSIRNITERKEADRLLREALEESRRLTRQTAALVEASRVILEQPEFEDAARGIFVHCKEITGATCGYMSLVDASGVENAVVFLDPGGRSCAVDPNLPMPIRGLRAEAYRTGRVVYENDFSNSPWTKFLPEGHVALDNVLFSPLVLDDEVVGFMGLGNKPGGFDHYDAQMTSRFAELAAIAFRNSQTLAALRSANKALQESSAAARAATRAKSEFLANMSHEIRTPMTAILGYLDILSDGCTGRCDFGSCEAAGHLATIRRNSDYLLGLINNILDLSKIEAGKLEVERLTCSPRQVLHDVVSLMRARAAGKGLSLEVDCDGSIPSTIQTDPIRLSQILINLVGNAVKFTDAGSVRIAARLVERNPEGPQLQFQVIDTGIGLTAEQIERLFLPFVQADNSTTRRFGGTGLGLTISKRLAEILGGDIAVASSPGQGSTFTLTVAAGAPDAAELPAPPNETPGNTLTSETTPAASIPPGCRILLAEDGPDNRRLLSYLLSRAGAEVTVAENGQAALACAVSARDEQNPFALVLMDMQMPVLDGYEATQAFRAAGLTLPIIALTAHAMREDRQRCLDAGCDDYMTKPIDREKLLNLVAIHAQPGQHRDANPAVVARSPDRATEAK